MILRKAILLTAALLACTFAQAQQKQYFQQEVNYKISVKLNDSKHELSASEQMEYINNSPDALSEIYIHLWPNGYKDNNTALAKQLLDHGNSKFYYATAAQRGYIDSLDFKVNGQPVRWAYDSTYIDICKLILDKPLKPGEKLSITTPFHVKIPEGIFSRLGHLGESYQVTQWYPKPAVYDRYGWHQMPYLNQGEFYSEFGSFDVSITLPKNYVLGATGDMVDGEQEQRWLDEKVKETEAIKEYSKDMSFPPSDKEWKTIRFKQSRVHDFAWFADKRFHVLKGEVELPYSKRKVTTWVMYTNLTPNLWKKSIAYMNNSVYYYSLWNGDYPYNHATAVDGALTAGGGMEYPNITVIGPETTDSGLETVIVHEVGHNWYYGILGSNERRYPFMDEGINSFYEHRYDEVKSQKRKDSATNKTVGGEINVSRFSMKLSSFGINRANYRTLPGLEYDLTAARHSDQALNLPAQDYTEINYGCDIYAKTPLCFDYLKGYLGEARFDKAMQAYYEKWKFKHPDPTDLRAVLEEQTGEKLDWFFDGLIGSTAVIDYKILSAKDGQVTVRNIGRINGPLSLSAYRKGKIDTTIWYPGFSNRQTLTFPKGNYDQYRIDAQGYLPEVNRQNNILSTHGLFRKIEPLRLQPIYSFPNPEKTFINYLPALGWNNYNKLMVGAVFYNTFLPQKPVEYMIMPMYGTGNNSLAGGADLGYNFISTFAGRSEYNRLGFTAERYAYDNRGGATINFNKLSPSILHYYIKGNAYRDIGARVVLLYNETGEYDAPGHIAHVSMERRSYTNVFMTFANTNAVNPSQLRFDDVSSDGFTKLSTTLNYKISYQRNSAKGIELRVFGGYAALTDQYRPGALFSLSGFTGSNDYMYDGVFLGRSEFEGKLSKQFVDAEGGFKTLYGRLPLTQGRDNSDYMATLNIKVPSPGKLPAGIFASIGTFKDIENVNVVSRSKYLYEAGIYFEAYFIQLYLPMPFLMPSDLQSGGSAARGGNANSIGSYIRFSLNLNDLRPFNAVRKIPY